MSDDIETRALAAAQKFQEWHANSEDADTVVHQSAQSDAIDYINAVERLVVDRDSLRKALDDRHADDLKAWKSIMRATGKECGIPPNKEVVAFYVAEVERLEEERDIWKSRAQQFQRERAELSDALNGTPRAALSAALLHMAGEKEPPTMVKSCSSCKGNSSDPSFNCSDCRNFDYWQPRTPEHDATFGRFPDPRPYYPRD
jgi:hypothetical protein